MNTGGRYDPASDTWSPTSTIGVPEVRYRHAVVWTGTEMIVWGGDNQYNLLDTGGRYNPGSDSWSPTSTGSNLPAARTAHTAVWTGSEMIVWGGWNGSADLATGGRYAPATNTWTPTSTVSGVPLARSDHSAVWTGTEMIIWGGNNGPTQSSSTDLNTGGRYNPATNSWTATSIGSNVPSVRVVHSAIWTGTEMIVWGALTGTARTTCRWARAGGMPPRRTLGCQRPRSTSPRADTGTRRCGRGPK